jgi:hypothetical protein
MVKVLRNVTTIPTNVSFIYSMWDIWVFGIAYYYFILQRFIRIAYSDILKGFKYNTNGKNTNLP